MDNINKEEQIIKLEAELKKCKEEIGGWNELVKEHNQEFERIKDKFMDFYYNDYIKKPIN